MPKGAEYERELKNILERIGFFVIRSAGSFATDLVAIKNGKMFAIEVKSTKSNPYYIKGYARDQLKELLKLKNHGIIPIFAVKFKRKGWMFTEITNTDIKKITHQPREIRQELVSG